MAKLDNSDRGVVFTAVGERYRREAVISATSARRFLPGIPILLFTDASCDDGDVFDEIVVLTKLSAQPHIDKLVSMLRSPFRETLFLDTDTYVCGSPAALFELLGAFDIAMAQERRYQDAFPPETNVPASFPEFNQGVVLFRQSDAMRAMFQDALDWAADFHRRTGKPTDDQTAMRIALYRSPLRIATLALEYNCRFHAFGYLNGPVKILHGRVPATRQTEARLERVARVLNRQTIPRVFVAGRIYALGKSSHFGVNHHWAMRVGTLFRPAVTLAKTLGKGCVRNALHWRRGLG